MITTILAIGITAFILMYFGSQMEKPEHWAIQLLMFSFAFMLLMLLAKGSLDATTVCDPIINTTTTTLNTTAYTYVDHCVTTTNNTEVSFFRLTLAIFGIYLAYVIYFLFYKMIMRFYEYIKKKM